MYPHGPQDPFFFLPMCEEVAPSVNRAIDRCGAWFSRLHHRAARVMGNALLQRGQALVRYGDTGAHPERATGVDAF